MLCNANMDDLDAYKIYCIFTKIPLGLGSHGSGQRGELQFGYLQVEGDVVEEADTAEVKVEEVDAFKFQLCLSVMLLELASGSIFANVGVVLLVASANL
jgi:hypothetical protein